MPVVLHLAWCQKRWRTCVST